MKCPNCQMENREGAKFCTECGENLEITCPKCGRVTRLASKFCDECGYTALSEKLDPEEVKEITSRLFSHISEVITKYEGVVEKFIGDAVVALFGAQTAIP